MKNKVLILENLRSVENTGSIFRTADGLGVSKIFLLGTTPSPIDRFSRKREDFVKVSLGAEESVPWEYKNNIKEIIEELKKDGFQILALEQTPEATPVKFFKPKEKFALIVGNEVDGISAAALKLVDKAVEIPMEGKKESFNVAVATGMALFVLT